MRRYVLVFILLLAGLAVFGLFSRKPSTPRETASARDEHSPRYVNPAECETCHREIAASYKKTGMGRSFSRSSPASAIENLRTDSSYYHASSDRYYTMLVRGGELFQRRHQLDPDGKPINVVEDRVDFVLGSGNHSRAYLHLTEQHQIIELPLAWYSENGGTWGMNPGYDWKHHSGFRRPITLECLFCHNGYPTSSSDRDRADMVAILPSGVPEGIDCQRCHGPGSAHVKDPQAGNIVNPAALPRDRNLEVCLQCHLETTSAPLPYAIRHYDRGVFSFQPGESLGDAVTYFDHAAGSGHQDKFEIAGAAYRLRMSQCFLKSDMTCTTCHNPHDIPRGEEASRRYNAACERCHDQATKPSARPAGHPRDPNCIGCHMPKRRTEDAVHVVMTDHFIQRRPPARNLLAPLAEQHETTASPYRGEVVLYYPASPTATADSELYPAVAQVTARANLDAGIDRLASAIQRLKPAEGGFYFELGKAYAEKQQFDQAIVMYREALARMGSYWPAQHRLGLALASKGQLHEALESLQKAAQQSMEGTVHNELGLLYRRLDRPAEGIAALKKAIEVDPRFAPAHHNLAGMLLDSGDLKAAESEFREAIRLQPDLAASHLSLGRLLLNASRIPEAAYEFSRAVREAEPGEPAAAQAESSLGNIFEMQGKLAEAAQHYGAAVTAAPGDLKSRFRLGSVLVMQNKNKEALEQFQRSANSADPAVRQDSLDAIRKLRP